MSNILPIQKMRTTLIVMIAMALFASGISLLLAQGTAYITGYVLDETGAVLPGVTIVIKNEATGASLTLISNDQGLYRSPALPPGTYEITATLSGFQKLVQRGVVLTVGQPLGLDLRMKVGEITETVEVVGVTPLLRTEDSGLGQTVEFENVQRLPYLNRSAGILLQLTPSVRYGGEDPISYGASRFNVMGVGNVNVMVNGAPTGGNRTDVNQQTFNPSVDSLQEVRVITNQYSAEYGMDVGALVLMQTKSGTNEFHGSVYEYFRNENMDARNAFTGTKPLDRNNMFGGLVGGPIIKNKLFFFTHHEGQVESAPAGLVLTVPTPEMLQGNFSGRPPIYDPATTRRDTATGRLIRDQFPNNVIPAERIDPVARNLVRFFPKPDRPGFAANLSGETGHNNKKYKQITKIDWEISGSDKLNSTWMLDKTDLRFRGIKAFNAIDPAASPNQHAFVFRTQVFNFEETHIFSPKLFMSNRAVYRPRFITRDLPAFDPAKKWGETLGLKNFAGSHFNADLGFPSFNFSGYTSLGPGFLLFQEKPIYEFAYFHTTSYVRGSHSLKFGFQTEKGLHGAPDWSHPTGIYNFGPVQTSLPGVPGTGDAIASFLLGQVDSATTTYGPLQVWYNWYYAAFVQDDWKVTPELTLNIGLRWDIDAPVYERENNMGNGFDMFKINPVSGTPGVITFKGRRGEPRSFYDTDWNRLAPRFGFAYQLTPKTVIRGGYGIYNTSPILGANRRAPNLGFTTSATFTSPDGGISPAFILGQGFPPYPLGGREEDLNDSFGAVRVGERPRVNVTFVQQKWNFGYAQNFNLSIQRELPGNMVFEIAGAGVLGRKLSVFWPWNEVPPQLRGLTGDAQTRRPFPQFGAVTQSKRASGTTNYYGLSLRAEKRFSHGFSLLAHYTWQKNTGILGVEDASNPKLSRGPVLYQEGNNPGGQIYHESVVSWIWELPLGPGKARLNSGLVAKILGGWDIGGILTLTGGIPFGLNSGGDSLNCFCGLAGRLNLIGTLDELKSKGNRTADRWFNTQAVAPPAFGQVGNLGPGVLTSPSNKILNLSIGKNIPITERINLRYAAEFFNFTNTPRLGVPVTNFRSPAFGRITGPVVDFPGVQDISAGARIIQMGLRINF